MLGDGLEVGHGVSMLGTYLGIVRSSLKTVMSCLWDEELKS